jgi:hypothetical protein
MLDLGKRRRTKLSRFGGGWLWHRDDGWSRSSLYVWSVSDEQLFREAASWLRDLDVREPKKFVFE